MIKILKFIKNNILVLILIVININVLANNKILSEQVSYTNNKTNETTVEGSLNELFSAVDINKRLGNTNEISEIGNGTVSNAISTLNTNLSNKLSLSGGTINGSLKVGNKLQLWTDNEGGNIYIISPNNYVWQMDSYNDTALRIFNHNGTEYGKFHSFSDSGITSGADVFTSSGVSLNNVQNQINTTNSKLSTLTEGTFTANSNLGFGYSMEKIRVVKNTATGLCTVTGMIYVGSNLVSSGTMVVYGNINFKPIENIHALFPVYLDNTLSRIKTDAGYNLISVGIGVDGGIYVAFPFTKAAGTPANYIPFHFSFYTA